MSDGVLISEDLQGIGATYCSILSFDKNNMIIYKKSSNPEWAEEFTSHDHYKSCHLLLASQEMLKINTGNFIVAWDIHKPFTDEAHELDEIRKKSNICHTLVNIAGSYYDYNFGANVLRGKADVYKELYKTLVPLSSNYQLPTK